MRTIVGSWLNAYIDYAKDIDGFRTGYIPEFYMRHHHDWLQAYIDYAGFSEAPAHMHFWAGVSAVAGALRRRVWIDMAYFKWYANHYIVFVAPPGIVSKSTTVAIAMDLLRKVPGINFGPDVVTWQALVSAFAASCEQFEILGEWHTQCALTLESSEFGNLVNPQDREMIDLLVTLWDAKQGAFKKVTKDSGNDTVENPWINMVACTTPSWIAGNFPEYIIGGGFTSRCLFVYTDKKAKYVAYPSLHVPKDISAKREALITDLCHIASALTGPYSLTPDAIEWGTAWYQYHFSHRPENLTDERFGGYLARKQTHIHKLAMVLAAAQRDELFITGEDLATSHKMISDLEKDMPMVFSKIGRSEQSIQADRFLDYVRSQPQGVPYATAYQYVHQHFTKLSDFEGMVKGAVQAGLITMENHAGGFTLRAVAKKVNEVARASLTDSTRVTKGTDK